MVNVLKFPTLVAFVYQICIDNSAEPDQTASKEEAV